MERLNVATRYRGLLALLIGLLLIAPVQLVRVVLREEVASEKQSDPFVVQLLPQYRVLELVDGVYTVTIWRAPDPRHVVDPRSTRWVVSETFVPRRRGVALDWIPFSFIGPNGTSPTVAKPPLEDLADVIVGHFKNSADHEFGLFMTALPTPWASGVADAGAQKLAIGPSVCWELKDGGKAGMLEFSGAGLNAIREAMASKERQMAVLGGRLLLEAPHSQGSETATSARLRYSAESATLRTIAGAVGAAMTKALRWHEWWAGNASNVDARTRVDLGSDFFAVKATPEEIRTALLAVQADQMSFETFYALLQQGGWARAGVTAEAERQMILLDGGRVDVSGDEDAAGAA